MRPLALLAPLAAALAAAALPGRPAAQEPHPGQATYRAVCAACHSATPPAAQAPPMAHIARRYLAADSTRAAARERLVAWVREPAPERSLMPPMAIERWGLMPPLLLPEAQLRDVADYVLTLADSAHGGRGPAMQHERPRRHRMRHGMQPDTLPRR